MEKYNLYIPENEFIYTFRQISVWDLRKHFRTQGHKFSQKNILCSAVEMTIPSKCEDKEPKTEGYLMFFWGNHYQDLILLRMEKK